jgi:hypothetical protein
MAFYHKWIEPAVLAIAILIWLVAIAVILATGHVNSRDIAPLVGLTGYCFFIIVKRRRRRSA